MAEEPRVLLFYVDAGGGHRSAARALCAAAEERRVPWRFEAVNFQSILAPLDFTRRVTGRSIEEFYNLLLRREWTAVMELLLRVLHGLIRLRYHAMVTHVARYLAAQRPAPALVLSVFPNFNGVIRDACRRALPGVPVYVVVTDLADFPPHFWIEPGLDGVIVATDAAAEQARVLGLDAAAIARVSGMILHPRFYLGQGEPDRRMKMRAELGFGAEDYVILLLFGGKGSPEIARLSQALLGASPHWRVVAICGDNPPLLARVSALAVAYGARLHVTGFTPRVADYMAASDLLVTKPGPGSLAEAWQSGLPVVVAGNRQTIPQERFNVRYVAERGLGVAVVRWADVPQAVRELSSDAERQRRLRETVRGLPSNKAVYEVLELIDARLQATGARQ